MPHVAFLAFFPAFAFGLAYLIGHSVITEAIRNAIHARGGFFSFAIEGVECPACLGFWIGFAVGIFECHSFHLAIFLGCVASGINFCAGRATGLLPPPHGDHTNENR